MDNNYRKSLANHLFNKINDYQNDLTVRNTKPMLWPSGLYFKPILIEAWINEHDLVND